MEPNQYQPQRTDFQSVPSDRPQGFNAGTVAVQSSVPDPAVQTVPPLTPAAVPELANVAPAPVESAAQPSPVIQMPTVTPAPPAPNPALDIVAPPSPDPVQPPVPDVVPPPVSVTDQPAPVMGSTPQPVARPWQLPVGVAEKTPVWKQQKFWLIASSSLFGLLLVTGVLIGYKATHHAPDRTIPSTIVSSVDTSSTIKTIGSTDAEKAANTQRQQAILSLRSYIEAFYTAKLHYPAVADMTNTAWVVANLKGLTADALKDPAGTASALQALPGKEHYAYQAGSDNHMGTCDNKTINCNFYQLTATLSDGSTFTKTALQ